jgi:hypothetical protein
MELPEPRGFDQPAHLEAFLDAVRWGAASIADTRQLQSPFRSGIEIESYQLDPVVRAIQMPRVNLLVADDVASATAFPRHRLPPQIPPQNAPETRQNGRNSKRNAMRNQLLRAWWFASGAKGRWFESTRAYHLFNDLQPVA